MFSITAVDADRLRELQDQLHPVYRQCFSEEPWNETAEQIATFPEHFARHTEQPGTYGFAAVHDGRLAGVVYGWPAPASLPGKREFEVALRESAPPEVAARLVAPAVVVVELMVAPEYRGQGLGRTLLARQVAGNPRAWLVTHPGAAAVALYESAGWVRRAVIETSPPRVLYTREATLRRHAVPSRARLSPSAPPDRRPRRRSF